MNNQFDLNQLTAELATLPKEQDYPLEQWNPVNCGTLPLLIDNNGQWWAINQDQSRSPYRRPKLIQLLSKLLWCEPIHYSPNHQTTPLYSLKTPHESVHIEVEDVPFLIVNYQWQNINNTQVMLCSTNLGESIEISHTHPLCIHHQPPHLPYVLIRRNLWARFNRNTYYQLINELLEKQPEDTIEQLSIHSHGHQFIITKEYS